MRNAIKRTIITTRDPIVARAIWKAQRSRGVRMYETRAGVFMLVLPGVRNRGVMQRTCLPEWSERLRRAKATARKHAAKMERTWAGYYGDACVSVSADLLDD